MDEPARTAWPLRHIERTADDPTAPPGLALPHPAAQTGCSRPAGIVGPCRDDGDIVPARRQPASHLARVLANTGELRREIKADEQKIHLDERQCRSIRVVLLPDSHGCHGEDFEVEPEGPMINV